MPGQAYARTRRAAARLLADRVRAGRTAVLKSEHGVGSSGTTVVTAREVREAGGARAVLRRLPRGPLLVEEYVHLSRSCTAFDAVFLPAIPTAAFDPAPFLGVLPAAHSVAAVDAAESLVREEARRLGGMFDPADSV